MATQGNYLAKVLAACCATLALLAVMIVGPATTQAKLCCGEPPENVSPPTISGAAVQGQVLTEVHGAWNGEPTSYSYQWEDCDALGNNCTLISGATGQTYRLTAGDVGHTIRVFEVAVNSEGSGPPAISSQSPIVMTPPAPPSVISPPTITGNTTQGQVLTEVHGTWNPEPNSYSYQWEDCDSSGSNCTPIAGATRPAYTLAPSDVGHTIRVAESATNFGGTGAPAVSSPSAVVMLPPVPTVISPPTVSGSAVQGQVLSESHGAWTNSPTSYSYQWEECDGSANNCTPIAGATSQLYTLTSSDVGHTIRVRETASDAGGSSSPANSAATALVIALVSSNIAAPTITGTAQQGQTLTAVNGSWTNSPTSFTHQWQRCDASGNNCTPIAGANNQTYTLTALDVGHELRVTESATNAGGSSTPVSSLATEVVQAASSGGGSGSGTGGGNPGTGSATSSGRAPIDTGAANTVTAKPLTQAQKRAKAIAACRKLKNSKRATCVAMAKKRYPLGKPRAHKKTRKRKGR